MSSEIEEKRHLIKLVFQNLSLKGKKVQFQGQKPFDTILNFANGPTLLQTTYKLREWLITNTTPTYLF